MISMETPKRCFRLPVTSPPYVMMSSDYSQQEPKLTAYISGDETMIQAFNEGKDIYATIASLAFNLPYEACLEFHPDTGEYQPDGKARRGEAKLIVLGITYGRSTVTIAEQLFGKDTTMSDEEKVGKAQKIYDAVLNAFPKLRNFMLTAQSNAKKYGYVETILGRRRHIPDMQLPEFEFRAMSGYVNPDIDPLDPSTLQNKDEIPQRIVDALLKEFKSYKYFGQIAKRTKELYEQRIKVINNRPKITEASRKCVNCVDFETEILTTLGWKRYNEVHEGDEILSYSLEDMRIVKDEVKGIHVYEDETDVVRFDSPTFSSVSTLDHRWVVGESDEIPRIKLTRNIYQNTWPDYPILRVADNDFDENPNISDDELKVLGWIMTDGHIEMNQYSIHIYQSTKKQKNEHVYRDMISTLSSAGIDFTDYSRDAVYHEIYLKKGKFTSWVYSSFKDRNLTFEFVSSLSQRQSCILMKSMLQGDGSGVDGDGCRIPNSNTIYACNSTSRRDLFQYLCFRAGFATNSRMIDPTKQDNPSDCILYESMNNIPHTSGMYYEVAVLRIARAQIYPHHKFLEKCKGVWCITSEQGTWVARRHGKVYITGNSIVQGSAAELTKMALIKLTNDPDWIKIGGRVLTPIHDELLVEVPMRYAEEGKEILSRNMEGAGSFLPFGIKCDVETTLRWYGLSYPCPYTKPDCLKKDLSEEDIKWIQYHLLECGYVLPVIKNEDGSKPIGDAAKGVNGVRTEEFDTCMQDYMKMYSLSEDRFLDHIHDFVYYGKR